MPLTKARRRKPTAVNAAGPDRRAVRARPENAVAVLARQVTAVVLVRKVSAVVLAAKVNAADRPAEALAILIVASRVSGARLHRRYLKLIWH